MGNNLSDTKKKINATNKTQRARANTSPILKLKNLRERASSIGASIRKKSFDTSDTVKTSATSSRNSSIASINNLSVNTSGIKPNKSSEKLSSLPQYLLQIPDNKSLSPAKVRKQANSNTNNTNKTTTEISSTNLSSLSNKTSSSDSLISPINRLLANTRIADSLIFNKSMALRPKTNPIYEDYIISKDVLGLGISGKVLSCTNKQTKVKYALKTLRESVKAKREIDLQWRACQGNFYLKKINFSNSFLSLLTQKGCPYIVQIKDVYENSINSQKVLLVVMECMEGGELFAKISERTTPFTEQEVAKIMNQICLAVKHLHSMSIAHRDLKPENLLLSTNDDTAVIKLTDFGFAKEVSSGLVTPCYYVAPEVLGSERYDISCDIWSLGVIMYILCCGYPPFYSTHGQPISPGMKRRIKAGEFAFPETEWSRVSQEAKSLIQGMLETIPEKRSTIKDVVRSNWISRYFQVPQTPLPSLEILREDRDNWSEVQQNMGKALDEMRINWESKVKLKELQIVNNPLFERRMNKKTKIATEDASMAPPPLPPQNHQQVPQDIEMVAREASMVSVNSVSLITPTNSRQSSPQRKN